ncbi:MAG: sigma-70 family RNA polymerase sigma factor [Bacteroidota bacterium]
MLLSVFIRLLGRDQGPQLSRLREMEDKELVAQYQATQRQEALAVLMDRYMDSVVGISMRYLKDEEAVRDFVGDMYVKLTNAVLTNEIKHFRSWLHSTVHNRLKDLKRKAQVRNNYRSQLTMEIEHMEPGVQRQMDLNGLKKAIANLSEKERLIVEAIYFQEMSYQEIMETYGWSFNQVRGTRDRAMKKLKAVLEADFSDYLKED